MSANQGEVTMPPVPDVGGWCGLVDAISQELPAAYPERATPGAQRLTWQSSGLASLTRDSQSQHFQPTEPCIGRLENLGQMAPVAVGPLQLLAERSLLAGLRGRPTVDGVAQSVGGTAWMLPALDGWFCLNLARHEDARSLSALLDTQVDHRDWSEVIALTATRTIADLDERARLLGLPAARVPPAPIGAEGSRPVDPQIKARHGDGLDAPFVVTDFGSTSNALSGPRGRPLLVVDLTSLWAGPLCGSLLAAVGCRVIKVEGRQRPDGARSGPRAFFDLMNGGKETVALDFADPEDRRVLDALLASADVVLESSRPRVMAGLGIDPADQVRRTGGCWVSITAYGRTGPWSNRVGFGDDVAGAAGVVVRSSTAESAPEGFVGDAIADPIGGLVAAVGAWHALTTGRSAVIDVALREALGFIWGTTSLSPIPRGGQDRVLRARPSTAAAAFDAHGQDIRREFAGQLGPPKGVQP